MAMAHVTPAEERFIPVEEYLRTSYRPDCDYVDGRVEERNWGEFEHGRIQGHVGSGTGQSRDRMGH